MLSSEVCVAKYHPALATVVSADASSFGLGAVLLQDQGSGERRAVAFASRSLTPTEQRYSQTEKEALAVTWAVQRFDEYVRGLQFLVETDHPPLTSLFGRMDEDVLPPRIQRLRLKLMSYQFKILHVPSKLLATADTVSRAPLRQASVVVCTMELFVENVVHEIQDTISEVCDGQSRIQDTSPVGLDRLRQEQARVNLLKYWKHRGEFTVCDRLLLKGSCLVIPSSLQHEVFLVIHEGHQRVNRYRARARDSVWWPGISKQIKSVVQNCEQSATTRTQRAEPLLPSPSPELPWQQLGIEFFQFNGQNFLRIIDYFSRYSEVITLRNTSCSSVVEAVKSVVARFSIPALIRSDNDPEFTAQEFADFGRDYGFKHVTSSPRYPQSNGEVTSAFRTIKGLFSKNDDPFLALLVFRDTPGPSGFSPAQLLMGRRLRTSLPKPSEKLKPEWPSTEVFLKKERADKRRQATDFNRRHVAKKLRPLATGEDVSVTDVQCGAKVLNKAQRPRSYVVETPRGVLQRNRKHLVPYKPPVALVPEPPDLRKSDESLAYGPLGLQQRTLSRPATPDLVSKKPLDPESEVDQRSQYGRAIVHPKKLNLQLRPVI
ncbi:uncharacterized protein ISCGN_028419 [Ixodes scapularis]